MDVLKDKIVNLQKDFSPVSANEWRALVNKDLEKAGLSGEAVWKYTEQLSIPIIATAEDENYKPLPLQDHQQDWEIRMDFLIADVHKTNAEIQDYIKKGVNAIGLKPTVELEAEDWLKVFEQIDLKKVSIHFLLGELTLQYWPALKMYLEDIDAAKLQGTFDFHPLSVQKKLGQEDLDWVVEVSKILPNFKLININQHLFHQKEKEEVKELAQTLAMQSEYLFQLSALKADFPDKDFAELLYCSVPLGCQYFIELGKLRALAFLWPKVESAYGYIGKSPYIQTRNSHLYTHDDPYWNMLRHTTMAMSAVLGGANTIHLKIEGEKENEKPDFFQRIAINVQNILKEEAKFSKVADPAAGAYYIENISRQIADKSWRLFQKIETAGGITKYNQL